LAKFGNSSFQLEQCKQFIAREHGLNLPLSQIPIGIHLGHGQNRLAYDWSSGLPFEQAKETLQHDRLRAWGEAPFAFAVLTIGFKEPIGFKNLALSHFPSPPDNLSGQEAALSDNPKTLSEKPKSRFVGVVVVAI